MTWLILLGIALPLAPLAQAFESRRAAAAPRATVIARTALPRLPA